MNEQMSNNVRFKWNAERRRAVQLLASGKLTQEEVAKKLNVTTKTLYRWSRHPAFVEEMDAYVSDVAAALRRKGIAERQNRIDALNDRHKRMTAVIQSRAAEYATDNDAGPGSETGLLCRTMKSLGSGPGAEIVTEWTFDAALVREMREHEKQTAQEVGQWIDRQSSLTCDVTKLSDEQLARIVAGEDPAAVVSNTSVRG